MLDEVDLGNRRILTGHKPEPKRGTWKPPLSFWDAAVLYRVKCLCLGFSLNCKLFLYSSAMKGTLIGYVVRKY